MLLSRTSIIKDTEFLKVFLQILDDSKDLTIKKTTLTQYDCITNENRKIVFFDDEIFRTIRVLLQEVLHNYSIIDLYSMCHDIFGSGTITKLFIYHELLFGYENFDTLSKEEQISLIDNIYYDWIDSNMSISEVIDEYTQNKMIEDTEVSDDNTYDDTFDYIFS